MNSFRLPSAARLAHSIVVALLGLAPFYAFLTVFGAHLTGHYTLWRTWDEVLLAGLGIVIVYWLVRNPELRAQVVGNTLVRLIAIYGLLTVVLGVVGYIKHEVTLEAVAYGTVINLRFLVLLICVWVTALRSPWLQQRWPKLLLVPAVLVGLFALLQYTVLPHDFLAHFGYGPSTIAPLETVNNNPNFIRVQSSLRGANPLGAYMVVVLAAAIVLWRFRRLRLAATGVAFVSLEALVFSFSRSAWLGAIAAGLVVLYMGLHTRRARQLAVLGFTVGIVLLLGAFVLLRHQTTLQNTLYHTDQNSQVVVSSNDARAAALRTGLNEVIHEPFGTGPGTAGPASVHNDGHSVRIAENYFLQIAGEVGWAGLVVLLGIFWFVGRELYRRRADPLAAALLASFVGITLVNMLSHAWTDDTLAIVWWGFAGLALARPAAGFSAPEMHTE